MDPLKSESELRQYGLAPYKEKELISKGRDLSLYVPVQVAKSSGKSQQITVKTRYVSKDRLSSFLGKKIEDDQLKGLSTELRSRMDQISKINNKLKNSVPLSLFESKVLLHDINIVQKMAVRTKNMVAIDTYQPTSEGPKFEKKYIATKDLAEFLGVSETTIKELSDDPSNLAKFIIQAKMIPEAHVDKYQGKLLSESAKGTASGNAQNPKAREIFMVVDRVLSNPESPTSELFFDRRREILSGDVENIGVSKTGKRVFIKLDMLGRGGFGVVTASLMGKLMDCLKDVGKLLLLAVKEPILFEAEGMEEANSEAISQLSREREIGQKLNGPFVIKTYKDPVDGSISMENCDGGELSKEKIKDLPPKEKWSLFLNSLKGVKGLHDKGYAHCDLKGGNILMKTVNGKLKPRIADFGNTREIGKPGEYGTIHYMPPEIFVNGKPQPLIATAAWDAYSMGIVALMEFIGHTLPESKLIIHKIPQYMFDSAVEAFNDSKSNLPNEDIKNALLILVNPDPSQRSIDRAIALIEQGISKIPG